MAHSLSPTLFAGFFAEQGIPGTYEALRVIQGQAADAILGLMREGYTGLNVTTPLKEEAFDAADACDDVAEFVRAANMVTFHDGRIEVGNSDGLGGVVALEKALGAPLAARSVLLLGVGPTGRAIAYNATKAGAAVSIWNRTPTRAHALVGSLMGARVWAPGQRHAIAFSTLPPGADLDDEVVAALQVVPLVLDANYGVRSKLGERLQRPVIDGYGMLIAQAEIAFTMWRELARSRA